MKTLYFILVFFILNIFYSCGWDKTFKNEAEFLTWKYEELPLTQKEISFRDSISNFDFHINITKLNIDRQNYYEATYSVEISNDTFYVDRSNFKDLIDFREDIIDQLCIQIIEDSILYHTKKINFQYKFPNRRNGSLYESYVTDEEFKYLKEYPVHQRLQDLGFKIIKDKNGKFNRIKI